MKLKTQYMLGITLSTIVPITVISVSTLNKKSLTDKQMGILVYTSVVGSGLIFTSHLRLGKRVLGKILKTVVKSK